MIFKNFIWSIWYTFCFCVPSFLLAVGFLWKRSTPGSTGLRALCDPADDAGTGQLLRAGEGTDPRVAVGRRSGSAGSHGQSHGLWRPFERQFSQGLSSTIILMILFDLWTVKHRNRWEIVGKSYLAVSHRLAQDFLTHSSFLPPLSFHIVVPKSIQKAGPCGVGLW